MNKILKMKNLLLILIALFFIVGGAYYTAYYMYQTSFQESKASSAIEKMETAQLIWPFFKYDDEFQNRFTILKNALNMPDITAFGNENVTEDELQILGNNISALPGVKNVRLISKQEALKIAKKLDPRFGDVLEPKMLPLTIEVYTENDEATQNVANLIEESGLIQDFQVNKIE